MPACDAQKYGSLRVALLFGSITLGILLTAAIIARTSRLFEFWARFYHRRLLSEVILYHCANLFLVAMVFLMIGIQIFRLRVCFEGSIYSITTKQYRSLKNLTLLSSLTLATWTIGNGVDMIAESRDGRIILAVLAVVVLILVSYLLAKLNYAFVSRLRDVTVLHTVHSSIPFTPSFRHSGSNAGRNSNRQSYSGKPSKKAAGVAPLTPSVRSPITPISEEPAHFSDDSSKDAANNLQSARNVTSDDHMVPPPGSLTVQHSDELMIPKMGHQPRLSQRPSIIAQLRRSSIYKFDDSQVKLLETASKATVVSIYLSMAVFTAFLSSLLFAISDCAEIPTIIGQTMISVFSEGMIGVCMEVSLNHSHYKGLCSWSNEIVQHIVAYDTEKQVLKIRHSSEVNNTSQ